MTLAPDDAADIMEEILEAQNQSFWLGMKLKLPHHEVEAINSRQSEPRDCLFYVIIAFLKQAEPRPTWRVIVEALRNRVVGLSALARRIEVAHISDSTSTRELQLSTGR